MRVNNNVSRKVFISSIVLLVIAILVGIYAASKEEYVISVAMIFVLLLQVANIIGYRRQNRNDGNFFAGGNKGNRGCRNGRGKF